MAITCSICATRHSVSLPLREHAFDWLRHGRRRPLPVDGYYEALQLVIEYRESQRPGPRH